MALCNKGELLMERNKSTIYTIFSYFVQILKTLHIKITAKTY